MMNALRKLLVFFSALVVFAFSIELFLISLTDITNIWMLDQINSFTRYLYLDPTLRTITLSLSVFFLIICVSVVFMLISFRRREKTISLQTGYGEVQIALGAIEDFIKGVKDQILGVHELHPKVFVRTTGLKIYVRASLYADQSIAIVAQEIQNTVRDYVQQTLGIDQPVDIRVFVSKILHREGSTHSVPSMSGGIQYQEFRQ